MSDEEICQKVREAILCSGVKMTWLSAKVQINYERLRRCVCGDMHFTASEWERIKQVLGI